MYPMYRSTIARLSDAPAMLADRSSQRRLQDPALHAALGAGDVPADLAGAVAGRFRPLGDPDLPSVAPDASAAPRRSRAA
jgi:hypothetical protein